MIKVLIQYIYIGNKWLNIFSDADSKVQSTNHFVCYSFTLVKAIHGLALHTSSGI